MGTINRRDGRGEKRDGERGVIAVLVSLLMTTFMGFAALGFDLSYVRLARLEMKNATDAAAHAANLTLSISGSSDQARQAAKDIVKLNLVLGKQMKLTNDDIVFGVYDFVTGTFLPDATPYNSVEIRSQRFSSEDANPLVSLTFGQALGYTEADVTQVARSAFRNRYFQLEVDITDSYLCDINNAADAAVELLKYLNGPGGSMSDWIGLDVFTASATPVTLLKNVKAYYQNPLNEGILDKWERNGSTLTSDQTKGIGVCNKLDAASTQCGGAGAFNLGGWRQCPKNPPAPVAPCASQFKYPNHDWMPKCSAGQRTVAGVTLYGGTDLGAAIKAGSDKLKAIGQGADPKILILVTDGAPMICTALGGGDLCRTNPPAGGGGCCSNGLTCGTSYTIGGTSYGGGLSGDGTPFAGAGATSCGHAHDMANDAYAQATAAADAGIDVYTVGFFGNSASKEAIFVRSLARGSTGDTTDDSTKLAELLKKIPAHHPPAIVK